MVQPVAEHSLCSEATTKGLDIRFVVTNIPGGRAQWLYDTLYCARGQAENLMGE